MLYAATTVCALLLVAYGLHLRYEDPLSSPVIGAEDPFTHIVLVKEHLKRGYFDRSLLMGMQSLYPPGLHILLATFTTLSGLDAYEIARLGPPVLGGFAIFATFVLGLRFGGGGRRAQDAQPETTAGLVGGVTAGLVATAVLAVSPEHIFRTNLLFPTALDLALLPVMLLALIAAVEGSRSHAIALALVGLALALAHPWVVALFVPTSLLYVALRVSTVDGSPVAAARRALLPAGVLVGVFAFAAVSRWEASDSGFGQFLSKLDMSALPPWGLPAAGGLAFAALVWVRLVRQGGRVGLAARVAGALGAGAVLAIALPLIAADPPQFVNYTRQIGFVAIALAIAGAVLAFLRPNPVALAGLAIAVGAFPFTAINFFQSWYLPHRTVVYLVVGVCLLAGSAVAALTEALPRLIATGLPASRIARWAALPVAALFLGAGVVGVIAKAPEPYPWYRYYTEDELKGFDEVASLLEAEPAAVALVGYWQPNMMLKALSDPSRVLFSQPFFRDADGRRAFYGIYHDDGFVLHVIVDKYTRKTAEQQGYDLGFLQESGFDRVSCACGSLEVYRIRGEAGS